MREIITITNWETGQDYKFDKTDVKAICNLLVDLLCDFADEELIDQCVSNVLSNETFYDENNDELFVDFDKIIKGDDE